MDKISRRSFFKIAGAGAAAAAAAPQALAQDPHAAHGQGAPGATGGASGGAARYFFFQPQEATMIETMVERLIPNDEMGPGAIEAGVPLFIDKQLAGAWGAGERLYRTGPWQAGTPQQGYQLPFTPAELFRNALRGIDQELRQANHAGFSGMSATDVDGWLRKLQTDTRELDKVPAHVFFDTLWSMTLQGYFSDPVYGGNLNMAAWKMIGFPGAYANYYDLVDRHNFPFEAAPISLAETSRGVIHIKPDIPASVHERRKGK